jgi:hypothetical protein
VGETIEVGLYQAYELLALFDDPVGKCWVEWRSRILNALQVRNNSILAHGFTAVTKEQYVAFANTVQGFFQDVRAQRVRIGSSTPDFPRSKQLVELCFSKAALPPQRPINPD